MSWTMTLAEIKAHRPCEDGWKKLRRFVGTRKPLSTVVTLAQILESNGVEAALWVLRCIKDHDREIRLLAVQCACKERRLMTDPRSIAALEMAALYAEGMEDDAALAAARDAGWGAGWAAAWDTAWAGAWAAARAAVWDAAWAAELAAARAATLKWQADEMGRMIRGEGIYDRNWADNL